MISLIDYTSNVKKVSTIGLIFATLVCLKTLFNFLPATNDNYFEIRTAAVLDNTSLTPITPIEYSDVRANTSKTTSIIIKETKEINISTPTNASDAIIVNGGNCSNSSNTTVQYEDNYNIVFVIPTHPSKITIRQAIRETWANVSAWSLLANEDGDKIKIKVMFVIGALESDSYSAEFEEELSQNDDIFVVSNITEGYYSLRYKVLWGMEYSYQHYKFDYLVKTDDDIIVNLPVLIEALSSLTPGLRYTGNCNRAVGSKPQRWKYCSGGGYILSRDLIGHILKLPETVHNHSMKPEDVFTGWLVWNVNNLNNVYNSTEFTVRPRYNFRALSLGKYKCGDLNKWFYHGYRGKKYDYRVELFREVFMNNSTIICEKKDTMI